MAEETKSKPTTTSATPPSDDVIDLEGLVRDIDLTPTSSITAKADAAEADADTADDGLENEPLHAEALNEAQFDELLGIEDPEMAQQIEALRVSGFDGDAGALQGAGAAISQDDDEDTALPKATGKLSFREKIRFQLLRVGTRLRLIRTFAIRLVKDSKGVLRETLTILKAGVTTKVLSLKVRLASKVAWLKSRNLAQKLALLTSIAVIALLIVVSAKTIQGTLLPNVERPWIASFTDHADGTFNYDADAPSENFNDPLLHPEFVILVERIVVNLSRTSEAADSANPMAAFELYLQTDTQDAAVEIKDRSVEIRDAVARSVERMTYPDLADEDGKSKLKLLIRKDLNEIITRGKVRRVFFKTIVLNPE